MSLMYNTFSRKIIVSPDAVYFCQYENNLLISHLERTGFGPERLFSELIALGFYLFSRGVEKGRARVHKKFIELIDFEGRLKFIFCNTVVFE